MRRGLTLTEVIVSLFLLMAGVLVMVNLFHSALRYRREVERKLQGTLMARSLMSEIRGWARDPLNFDSNWTAYDGQLLTDPDFPGFEARVEVEELGRVIYSPCSQFEVPQGALAHHLDRSLVAVAVEVGWGDPNPARRVRLVSYVGEPPRQLAATPVVVTRTGGAADPVPPDQTVDARAELRDDTGQPIADVSFSWGIQPSGTAPGNGTLLTDTVPRSQQTMTVQHFYVIHPHFTPPETGYAGGELKLRAAARYRGREVIGESTPIVFQ